ncbi:type I-E CRISPR-associated protein Cas7/Cse4/CasC [Nesterenkonia sp. CL21]|uniref:type I-E CRISPR-associated protein Cas7/Cse4/CasC n=1 Tax=Nesterenkonia sp. CL21 TaxID=3064894 RepID=UPI002878292F|nr:type I-E CRISPR-associated protein Cas7/Cse4/CasC [Nesterenkonia sp. CL21]MDS2172675.1 type I-E CRISPR-associated protein Cas7/Cse4/CasC [Nesterenkonia sp. CL21]
MTLYIDVHALHTLPPNNINRDDTGAPKTATFGGVPRQRVSSQAWKRAIRKDFPTYLSQDKLGTRTKRVVEKTVTKIRELDGSWETARAAEAVEAVFDAARITTSRPKPKKDQDPADDEEPKELLGETSYLLFLSTHQIERVARHVIEHDGAKPSKKDAQKLLDEEHSVDIAMFGRMVADSPNYNVDAAVQVAHALGTSAAEPEFDYYTAVDDVVEEADETGAGMIGTVQMMSSTLYRYATVNMAQLEKNLASREAATEAAKAFVQAFVTSMPTGKQNAFANRTMPEAVVVSLRSDRPVSWVNAFEEPVVDSLEENRRSQAARKLAAEAAQIAEIYDAPAEKTWVMAIAPLQEALSAVGTQVSRKQLLDELESALATEEPA